MVLVEQCVRINVVGASLLQRVLVVSLFRRVEPGAAAAFLQAAAGVSLSRQHLAHSSLRGPVAKARNDRAIVSLCEVL